MSQRADISSGANRDLEHPILAAREQFVCLHDLIQGKTMGEQRQQIELFVQYQLHQAPHTLFSTRAQRL